MDEQDAALNQIAAWLADPAPTAEASARMAPLLLSLVVEILVGGRSDEASLGQELRARLHRDPQAKWHLVESLPAWWRKKRVRDGQVDARIFVERCADQVAMLLTFPNFKTVARSGLNLDAVLFRRSGRAIYWSVKRGEHTEEELSHCVEAMLAVADKFEFQNLGAAINYFKKAVRRRLFPRKPKSIQAPVRFRDERVADPQADDEGAPIEEEPEEVAEPKAASLDDSSEVDLTEERQRAWEELQRKLRPKHAVRFWVLLVLYENGKGHEWEEIARLLRQSCWCQAEPCCVPPDLTVALEAEFAKWAKRSRALSAANLRQTYSRLRKALHP